jgi:hypothetical protein
LSRKFVSRRGSVYRNDECGIMNERQNSEVRIQKPGEKKNQKRLCGLIILASGF